MKAKYVSYAIYKIYNDSLPLVDDIRYQKL